MRNKFVLSAVAFIFLFIAAGFAQDYRSEFSVQGTANLPKNSTNIDIPHDATKSGGFLIGYRYHLNSWFAIQGDYGYTRDTQKYFDPFFGETDIQASIHQLTGEAVISAPSKSRVRPYGLAGIGALFFVPTNSLNNSFVGVGQAAATTRPSRHLFMAAALILISANIWRSARNTAATFIRFPTSSCLAWPATISPTWPSRPLDWCGDSKAWRF